MLQRPQLCKIVCWAENQNGFIIKNLQLFSTEILPQYFKHKKYTSFVRQLNMYGFHKQRHSQNQNYFYHSQFKKGDEPLAVCKILTEIKRKPEKKKKNQGESDLKISENPQNSQIKMEEVDNSDDDRVSIKIQEDKKEDQLPGEDRRIKDTIEIIDENGENRGIYSEDEHAANQNIAHNSLFGVFIDGLLKQNQSLRTCHQVIRSELLRVKKQALKRIQSTANHQNLSPDQKSITILEQQNRSSENLQKFTQLLQKQQANMNQLASNLLNQHKASLQ